MDLPEMMRTAAEAANDVVQGVKPDQLGLHTPCKEWDVRALVNHLFVWSVHASELVARKEPVDLAALMARDFMTGDWAKEFAVRVDRAASAWAVPGAVDGTTTMGGDTQFPASYLGEMLLGELVLHGWDLAQATGQQLRVDDEVAEAVLQASAGMADEARSMHLFGEPANVPDSASALDQALAVTGRDPGWVPAA